LNIFKRFGFGKIKGDDSTNGSTIVSISDSPKALLSSGIPNLIFDIPSINIDSLGGELNSNGWFGVHVKGIIYKARKQIGLADS